MMKKKCIIFVLACMLLFRYKVYGYQMPVENFDLNDRFVFMEDIFALNEQYIQNPRLDINEATRFLFKRYQKYADLDSDSIYTFGRYDVINEDGYCDYICNDGPEHSSSAGTCIVLISRLTDQGIYLDQPKEKIEEFISYHDKIAEKIREQYFYVRNHLSEDEYGGMYYDYDSETLCVLLTDESRAPLLEKKGIFWEKTEVSRNQIYEKLQYLWKEREPLNLTAVHIDMESDIIGMYGYDTEQEFQKKLKKEGFERDFYVQADNYYIINQDTLEEYIENKRTVDYDFSESYWNKLQECLEQMKKIYPEYTYENFYTLAGRNCDYEKYSGFEEELEEFVDSIPYQKNEKNPFDEERYGDPEQIALKTVLEKYKVLYPEKDYQELYEQYGKEINESRILFQEEKRSRYLWEIFQAEQLIEENVQKQKEKAE